MESEMSRSKELLDVIERIQSKLALHPDGDRLIVMAQNPANHYHWSKPVGGHVSAAQLREILHAAWQIIEVECLLESEPEGDDIPERQNPLCDPHPNKDEVFP
jgi:hypothetical protein